MAVPKVFNCDRILERILATRDEMLTVQNMLYNTLDEIIALRIKDHAKDTFFEIEEYYNEVHQLIQQTQQCKIELSILHENLNALFQCREDLFNRYNFNLLSEVYSSSISLNTKVGNLSLRCGQKIKQGQFKKLNKKKA